MNYKEKAGWSEWNCQLTNTTEQKFDNSVSKRERVWMFIKVNVDRSQVVSKYIYFSQNLGTKSGLPNNARIDLKLFYY